MENFIITGLVAGTKQKGEGAGKIKVSEIHLSDRGTDDDFYISLMVNGNDICIYDTDNPTYHIQTNDGKEKACENFDELMQMCCTIETTRDILMESPNSTWNNLYRFLLAAAESSNLRDLGRPYINHRVTELPKK